jgi:hypothetical protein
MTNFEEILKTKYNIEPYEYMKMVKKRAKELGYVKKPEFSKDGKHKLEHLGVNFGNVNNKDYIIYLLTEGPEKANKMRKAYWARTFSPKRKITTKMEYSLLNW